MTKAELITAFYRYLRETQGQSAITSGDEALYLDDAYEELVTKYQTYIKIRAVPFAEEENYKDLADIQPSDLGSATVDRPIAIQWKRGEVGAVTSVADDTDAVFTCESHGLSDDDVVQHYDFSQDYNVHKGVVTVVDDDTYTVAEGGTTVAYGADDTGYWLKSSNYPMRSLIQSDFFTVEQCFTNSIEPSVAENPEGMAFIWWSLRPDGLPTSGDIPQYILPERYHGLIAMKAVADAGYTLPDFRAREFERLSENLEQEMENRLPLVHSPEFFGSYKYVNGLWAFRNTERRSLVLYPGTR